MKRILPLDLKAAVVTRGGKPLIGPIDMRVEGGGISVIMGPNGSGKTTLLRLCHGLLTPTAGRCTWLGPEAQKARRHQALVFQRPAVLRRSVRGNVEYPLKLRGTEGADRRARAEDVMARARLMTLADRPAEALSGGEQQRLAIARAWVTRPEVLFLDEPTASLDPGTTRDIETLIQSIAEAGTSIVMTSHDLGQIKRLATTVLFLFRGQIIEKGTVAAIFDTPKNETLSAFLAGEIVE